MRRQISFRPLTMASTNATAAAIQQPKAIERVTVEPAVHGPKDDAADHGADDADERERDGCAHYARLM